MNTTSEQDRLWQAFHERAAEGFYGYIPAAIENSDSVLAADLRNLITALHDVRRNTLRAIADSDMEHLIGGIQDNLSNGTLTAVLHSRFGEEAHLEVGKGHIRAYLRVAKLTLLNHCIRFDNGELRRFCEATDTAPRLDALIDKQLARLIRESELVGNILHIRMQENREKNREYEME